MSTPESRPKHAPLPWRWILIASTVAGILLGLRLLFTYRTIGPGISVFDALVSGLMESWLWILVAPLAVLAADRFEPFRSGAAGPERRATLVMWTVIGVHAMGAFVASFAHLFLFSALSGTVRHFRFGDAFRIDVASPISALSVRGVIVYAVVVIARWWSSSRTQALEATASARELASRLEERARPNVPAQVAFPSGRGTLYLRPDEVHWVQAAGNYLELHTTTGSHLVRETLSNAHGRLGRERFVQIHRSTIVRGEAVVGSTVGRRPAVLLADGTKLPVGASYRARMMDALGLES